jgi:hypothetical protein
MPMAHVGQNVQVNVAGLQTGGISVSGGVTVSGVITGLNPAKGTIIVRLGVSFDGMDTVEVTPDRVSAL